VRVQGDSRRRACDLAGELERAERPGKQIGSEVAVTSWGDDLAKLPSYAAAGVGVVWLINVPVRQVHLFEHPHERHYGSERVLAAGDTLHAPVDGVPPLPLSELFADFG
jgi:hypothetical protein